VPASAANSPLGRIRTTPNRLKLQAVKINLAAEVEKGPRHGARLLAKDMLTGQTG
jgi:hypothetical protein